MKRLAFETNDQLYTEVHRVIRNEWAVMTTPVFLPSGKSSDRYRCYDIRILYRVIWCDGGVPCHHGSSRPRLWTEETASRMESSRGQATRCGSPAWRLDTTSPQQTIVTKRYTGLGMDNIKVDPNETGCEGVVLIWLRVGASGGLL
jgi:hypothetical protein